MKVLVAIDGSAGSLEATRQAGTLLDAERDQLVLYYSPPQMRLHQTGTGAAELRDRARAAMADAVFAEGRKQLPSALASRVSTIVGTKAPRQGILVAADECRADLVVVGARGMGPMETLLLGSVSLAVVHAAKYPVLVARARPAARAGEPLHVLLACDKSEGSAHAAAVLQQLHFPVGTSGQVMRVVEPLLVGEVPEWLQNLARDAETEAMAQAWVKDQEALVAEAREDLMRYEQHLQGIFAGQRPIVAEGNAAEQILKVLHAQPFDLVVTGGRGRNALERLFLGSTSHKILSQAPCSVLIVPHHDKP